MKLPIATLLTLLVSTSAHAYEQPGNPDRFVSMGFNVRNIALGGNRYETSLPGGAMALLESGPQDNDVHSLGLDLRIPMTRSLTFNLSYDSIESETTYNRRGSDGSQIWREATKLDGHAIGLGVRIYFNR